MQIVEISDRSGGGQDYFAGRGLAAGAGGVAAAAGAGGGAEPGGGGAGGGACGCAAGLIQQAWTRLLRLSGTLGSISEKNRVRQRKAAWTCPPGQPNRS